jgi:serine/threonine protein kinase
MVLPPNPADVVTPPSDGQGDVRIGRYQVLEKIGMGGMAEVFRVCARGPGGYRRELIIKRVLPHLIEDESFVQAFVEEAKILGLLNHPNVVGVYDFGQDDGRHYLALEYLDGPSVADLVVQAAAAERLIPVGLVAYIGREVCNGLQAVHSLRDPSGRPLAVVHRDVTPSNIMTTRGGAVKLLDFGVAKTAVSEGKTAHGYIKGKVGYFAPEQIKGLAIDGRVDLFALGVVLHEALCLEYLFSGEGGPLGAVYRTLEMQIPGPSERRGDVPPELDAVVMKALARAPEHRYATAEQMAHDLSAVVDRAGADEGTLAAYLAGTMSGAARG